MKVVKKLKVLDTKCRLELRQWIRVALINLLLTLEFEQAWKRGAAALRGKFEAGVDSKNSIK